MSLVKQNLGKWIQAAIILVCGILCIVAGAAMGGNNPEAAGDALNGISLTIGIVLIVVGSLSFCLAVFASVLSKKGFALIAFPGALIIALGISLVVAKYAAALIDILLTVVPYLLIAIGVVILVDAILKLVAAIKAKKTSQLLVSLIVSFIVATVAIVLGFLCVGNDPVIAKNVQLIVFGIVVVLNGVAQFVSTFYKLPDTILVVSKK